jgi:hypothetical protein
MTSNLMQAGVNATGQLADKAKGGQPQVPQVPQAEQPQAQQQQTQARQPQPQEVQPTQQSPQPEKQEPQKQEQTQQAIAGGEKTKALVDGLKQLWNMSLSEATTYDGSYFHFFLREADGQAQGVSKIGANYKKQAAAMKDFVKNPSADKVDGLKAALTQLQGKAGENSKAKIDELLGNLEAASQELKPKKAEAQQEQPRQAATDQAAQPQNQEQNQTQPEGDPASQLLPLAMKLSPKMLALKQQGKSQFTKEDVPALQQFVDAVKKSVGGQV